VKKGEPGVDLRAKLNSNHPSPNPDARGEGPRVELPKLADKGSVTAWQYISIGSLITNELISPALVGGGTEDWVRG